MKRMKPWLRGGLIGVAVCVALFLFYVFVYFPIGMPIFNGMLPFWFILLPMITGHFFPLTAGFIVPWGWLCERTEIHCQEWTAEIVPNCVPYTTDGFQGCCLNQVQSPTGECAVFTQWLGFGLMALVLLALYFVIGAAIATFLSKRKKKK